MSFSRKYAFVLALAVAVIYVYVPLGQEDIKNLPLLDDINAIINKSFAPANPDVRVSPVDPVAAANIDEDLDYRIAQRLKSIEEWPSFLEAHPNGAHAQFARAELDKLVAVETPPALAAASVSKSGSLESETPSEAASPGRPSPGSEVATLGGDEICTRDESRLERLSNSRSSDEAMQFLTELRCEKLRLQLFRLTERLDYQDPTPAAVATSSKVVPAPTELTEKLDYPAHTAAIVATQGPSSSAVRAKLTRVAPASVARWRATEPQQRARWSVASRSLQPRRPANGSTGPSLPPIFLALFGEEPGTQPRS